MSTNIQTQSTNRSREVMKDIQNKPMVWLDYLTWWRINREQEYHRASALIWEQDDIMWSGATSGQAKRPPQPSLASCRPRAREHDPSVCQSERRRRCMMTIAYSRPLARFSFPTFQTTLQSTRLYLFIYFCQYLRLVFNTRIPLSGVFVELRVSFNVSVDCFRKWTGNKGNQCTWLPLSPEIVWFSNVQSWMKCPRWDSHVRLDSHVPCVTTRAVGTTFCLKKKTLEMNLCRRCFISVWALWKIKISLCLWEANGWGWEGLAVCVCGDEARMQEFFFCPGECVVSFWYVGMFLCRRGWHSGIVFSEKRI